MDIWHRVGRIVRFSNLGTLLFFTLNILLIVAVFGSSGSIVELICIYFFTVAISLSPLGEMCLAAFAGASDIKRVDIKLRVVPLVQYVLDKAKENTSYCPKKVKVKIIHDPAPNAFALGRQTLCITDGLLLLSDDMILGILAHEIGHLSYGHTVIQLLIGGGNIFISGCLLLIKISYWIFSAIMGLFAICSRSGVMGIITAVFAGISTALSWLWVKFCMLFLMWSMRQNEYLADEFAYKIGFGLELATVLDQHISDVPHDGFQVHQYGNNAHKSHFPVMFHQCSALLFHQIPAEVTEIRFLVAAFQSPHQVGSVQITGGFSCYQIILHN